MKVDLREFTESRGRIAGRETATIEDPALGPTAVMCDVDLEYLQTAGAFHFHANVKAAWESRCSRCLDSAHQAVAGDFHVMVRRAEHGGEVGDDVVNLGLNEHDVSFEPFIRETLILNTPMVCLCREDCAGLCPSCGVNRNRETCACTSISDPRWNALRQKKLE